MADEDREQCLKILRQIEGKDNDQYYERQSPYQNSNTKYYIVSSKWLNKWKRVKKISDDVDENTMEEDINEINSEDIIDTNPNIKIVKNHVLKPGLRLGVDYEAIPKKAWKYFKKNYTVTHKIVRKCIKEEGNHLKIEITLFPLNVVFAVDRNLCSLDPLVYHFSRVKTFRDIIYDLESDLGQGQYQHYSYSKLWKLNRDTKITDLNDMINNSMSKSQIIFPGELIDDTSRTIEKAQIAFDDIIVFEHRKSYQSTELFKEKDKEICEYCRRYTYGGRKCYCKKFYYCNDMCEEKDRNFHYCRKFSKIFTKNENSCMGKTGLQNLGNTCYMNSGLQCLSNTKELTDYILEDKHINEINRNNTLGSKGELVTEYAALIKEMWYGTSHYVSPWGLKRAFSDFAKQFIGYHQQDSQEMLSFLIDGIHEDLNRIEVKPYVEDPDIKDLSNDEISYKFWTNL